jgi:hypothetical protein
MTELLYCVWYCVEEVQSMIGVYQNHSKAIAICNEFLVHCPQGSSYVTRGREIVHRAGKDIVSQARANGGSLKVGNLNITIKEV